MDNEFSITDDFLKEEWFVELRDTLLAKTFPWFFSSVNVYDDDDEENTPGFLCHIVFTKNVPTSELYEPQFLPILNVLEVSIVSRIMINLNWRLPKPFVSTFHLDTAMIEQQTAGWTTSILYINTNNGYTELETGERIECIANRLVTFPANIKHRVCTQTDTQKRILINFNYLKQLPHETKAI
jgi:hypothetical protein